MCEVAKDCWQCKHLQKSIYMKLEDDTLYNVWCKEGNIEDPNCDKFEKENKGNGNKTKRTK